MIKNRLSIIFEEVFQVSFVGYLFFVLTEAIQEGFISSFFEMNILLAIVLVSGIGHALLGKNTLSKVHGKNVDKDFTDGDILTIGVFTIATGVIVYVKTSNLGDASYLISILSGVVVLLLSYLSFKEKPRTD